ncbi:MAG: histidine kinase, partial [Anaeromyxobacteraceae bacterium]
MAATLFLVTAFWWVAYRLDAWSSPALLAGLAAPMGAQIALHWSFRWFAAARGRLAIYFALQLSLIILFGEVGRSDPWMYQFLLMLLAEAVAVLRSPRAQTAAAGIQVELERLTLAAERQRLARELHDTLAQGLVGLTLQLEALDAHLGRGEVPKSIAIVRGAAARARSTLADARTAIADL